MKEMICIVCPIGCRLSINSDMEVEGNLCEKGEAYAIAELNNPLRVLTSTVKIEGSFQKQLPVKTSEPIPKDMIFDVIKELSDVTVSSPIKVGDVVISDIKGLGIDIVATQEM